MDTVEKLSQQLRSALMNSLSPGNWGNAQLMTKELAKHEKAFGLISSGFNHDHTENALQNLRQLGRLETFRDWKHACFGVSQSISLGLKLKTWRLLEDDECFNKLLTYVDSLKSDLKRFSKCYLGLLTGYFSYPILAEGIPVQGRQNWGRLRDFLNQNLPALMMTQRSGGHKLIQTLNEHQNLLQSSPCARYSRALLDGDSSELDDVMRVLGIPTESWIRELAILAQFEQASQYGDQAFQDRLEQLLGLIQGERNFTLSTGLARRCTALLISRYAQCSTRPEHPQLRDAAVQQIGNPWLKKAAWDAYVRTKDGKPNEDARQMVNGWLKRRLIRDFFELLSDDGSADMRRLSYWLRFEEAVDDMWFALGPHAQDHRGKEFVEFRNRADGRRLKLEGSMKRENNAFIMRLGDWVIVEFGSTSNACYVYRWNRLPFDLAEPRLRSDKSGLKSPLHERRGIHIDSSATTWEHKFDEWLCPMLNYYPDRKRSVSTETKPRSSFFESEPQTYSSPVRKDSSPKFNETVFLDFASRHRLSLEDNRPKGGMLWVRLDDRNLALTRPLRDWGFKYKPDKGWWKE